MKVANFSSAEIAQAMSQANNVLEVCPIADSLETLKQLKKDSRELREVKHSQSYHDVQAEVRAGFYGSQF